MFNQVVVKNLTPAVLAGIGTALLNLNVLSHAFMAVVTLCIKVSLSLLQQGSSVSYLDYIRLNQW